MRGDTLECCALSAEMVQACLSRRCLGASLDAAPASAGRRNEAS